MEEERQVKRTQGTGHGKERDYARPPRALATFVHHVGHHSSAILPCFRTRSSFQGCCAAAPEWFRPAQQSCRSEPDGSGAHVSLGLPQAEPRSEMWSMRRGAAGLACKRDGAEANERVIVAAAAAAATGGAILLSAVAGRRR